MNTNIEREDAVDPTVRSSSEPCLIYELRFQTDSSFSSIVEGKGSIEAAVCPQITSRLSYLLVSSIAFGKHETDDFTVFRGSIRMQFLFLRAPIAKIC